MSLNGSGTYTPPSPENPVIPNTTILAADFNTTIADIAAAMSLGVYTDGQSTYTANQSFGGFKTTDWSGFTGTAVTGTATSFALTTTAATTITAATLTLAATTLTLDTTALDLSALTTVTLPAGTSGVTAVSTDVSTLMATTAFVAAATFNTALPAQAGNSGSWITTNGTDASWINAINYARGTVAMHATTMDIWAQPNIIDGTGAAVTITDIANAPNAGATRSLYPTAGTIITNGAVFSVVGAQNYTSVLGDRFEIEAVTVSTFIVDIVKADGTAVIAASGVGLSERTSNTILGVDDSGKIVDITSGTFTQTFDAVATLEADWFVYLRNSGTGDITLDPNGSEEIDGLTSFVMYPGESRLIQCDGGKLTSVVLTAFTKSFTASGTFTKPPGYKSFGGLLWSGGNSGQRDNNTAGESNGGGGGGCGDFNLLASAVGTTETVTIGSGGAAVTTVANGNQGGTSSFGSLFFAYANSTYYNGGSIVSGLLNTSIAPSGYEGAAFAGTVTLRSSVWGGASTGAYSTGASGSSVYGGAGGGSVVASGVLRAAGTSLIGGDGGDAVSTGNGVNGSQPAGGGGATHTGTQSGAGGDGQLDIWGI